MTLSQESIERRLIVFRELGFRCFPHDAIVSDDSGSVERSLLDQLPTYPPQKKANKSVESNRRGGVWRSFHVTREWREDAERRCPPVPHLLRSPRNSRVAGFHAPLRGRRSWRCAAALRPRRDHTKVPRNTFHTAPTRCWLRLLLLVCS